MSDGIFSWAPQVGTIESPVVSMLVHVNGEYSTHPVVTSDGYVLFYFGVAPVYGPYSLWDLEDAHNNHDGISIGRLPLPAPYNTNKYSYIDSYMDAGSAVAVSLETAPKNLYANGSFIGTLDVPKEIYVLNHVSTYSNGEWTFYPRDYIELFTSNWAFVSDPNTAVGSYGRYDFEKSYPVASSGPLKGGTVFFLNALKQYHGETLLRDFGGPPFPPNVSGVTWETEEQRELGSRFGLQSVTYSGDLPSNTIFNPSVGYVDDVTNLAGNPLGDSLPIWVKTDPNGAAQMVPFYWSGSTLDMLSLYSHELKVLDIADNYGPAVDYDFIQFSWGTFNYSLPVNIITRGSPKHYLLSSPDKFTSPLNARSRDGFPGEKQELKSLSHCVVSVNPTKEEFVSAAGYQWWNGYNSWSQTDGGDYDHTVTNYSPTTWDADTFSVACTNYNYVNRFQYKEQGNSLTTICELRLAYRGETWVPGGILEGDELLFGAGTPANVHYNLNGHPQVFLNGFAYTNDGNVIGTWGFNTGYFRMPAAQGGASSFVDTLGNPPLRVHTIGLTLEDPVAGFVNTTPSQPISEVAQQAIIEQLHSDWRVLPELKPTHPWRKVRVGTPNEPYGIGVRCLNPMSHCQPDYPGVIFPQILFNGGDWNSRAWDYGTGSAPGGDGLSLLYPLWWKFSTDQISDVYGVGLFGGGSIGYDEDTLANSAPLWRGSGPGDVYVTPYFLYRDFFQTFDDVRNQLKIPVFITHGTGPVGPYYGPIYYNPPGTGALSIGINMGGAGSKKRDAINIAATAATQVSDWIFWYHSRPINVGGSSRNLGNAIVNYYKYVP